MTGKRRSYPEFALCGLNCGLCPRYHTEGKSRCPGCGGEGFESKHPTCAVMTCNKRHENVEYCFQCSAFPCARYAKPNTRDSFITYRHVLVDFKKASEFGIERYRAELDKKIRILEFLIKNCNDGRRKGFYCLAVNLLGLPTLEAIMDVVTSRYQGSRAVDIDSLVRSFEAAARKAHIELKLRK